MISLLTLTLLAAPQQGTPTTVAVTDAVVQTEVKRFGVNLGRHNDTSAEVLLRNIIPNGGFEPSSYRMVTHAAVGTTGDNWLQDFWRIFWNNDPLGVGQQEGFWNGAQWEIVTGPSAGRSGVVLDYTHIGDNGNFLLDSTGANPSTGDIMFVTKTMDEMPELNDLAVIEKTDLRPGTLGVHSVRLSVDPAQLWRFALNYYMDSEFRDNDTTAGKLQLIDGDWKLGFWAKGVNSGDSVRIRFQRTNEATFFDEVIPLTTSWQYIERNYSFPAGTDDPREYTELEPHPILALGFTPSALGEEVLMDEIVFERPTSYNSPFLDEVHEALNTLQPGTLRFWAFHFGESLDNALALREEAGYSGFSPSIRMPTYWTYSLPDFLKLCQDVGADPWYVMPTTWTQAEIEGLVEYLAGPADGFHPYADLRAARGQVEPWTTVFDKIHVEYGNESWGGATETDPMFGASLLGGINTGQVADARFSMMRAAPDFDDARFDLIIGGQATNPNRQLEIETNSSAHNTVGVAPYYLRLLDDISSDEAIFQPVYADAGANAIIGGKVKDSQVLVETQGQGSGLAIYELNFHTTKHDANNPISIETRNDVVSSHAGSLALPIHMLTWLRDLGIKTQITHSLVGFSGGTNDGEKIRLFGIMRDLLKTNRARPNFLAMQLMNLAIRGDMVATAQGGGNPSALQPPINGLEDYADLTLIQSFAFRQGPLRTMVLFNLDMANMQQVLVDTSGPVRRGTTRLAALAPADPYADNEDSVEVEPVYFSLPGFQDGSVLNLPPASMVVLVWRQ